MTGWDLAASDLAARRRHLLFSLMKAEVDAGHAQATPEGWYRGKAEPEVERVFYSAPVQVPGLPPGAIAFTVTCPQNDGTLKHYQFVVDTQVQHVTDLDTGTLLDAMELETFDFLFALGRPAFRYPPRHLCDEILHQAP